MANDELIEDLRLELNDWDPDGVVGPKFKRALDALEAADKRNAAQLDRIQELGEIVSEFANALTLHKERIAELAEERKQMELEMEHQLTRARVETLELVRQDIRVRALDILHAPKRENTGSDTNE